MNTPQKYFKLRTALAFAGVLSFCIAAGSTGAQAQYALRISPEQTALARDTCSNVMRIRPGMVPFDDCVESLSKTLSNQTQREILDRSYEDCFASGQRQGTPELAACVLSRKSDHSATWNRNPSGMVSKGTFANYSGQSSYFESNAEERRRKEEFSCAQLGMLPGSAGFGQCVAQLDASLQHTD